ncbi:HlyU family transcriptional regulator [Inquilinus sp. YAF38]|uniref:HlyU family transcriptional regulator n=1 Tax=Inquilinus sp. YAF38 TaxID=3233084 RepID=UPI003F93BB31
MVSFLKSLFGGGKREEASSGEAPAGPAVEYKGYRIRPAPFQAGGQYQTSGIIEKDFPEGTKTHRFIRADKHGSKDDATAFSVTKAQQIIDEQGDRVFAD